MYSIDWMALYSLHELSQFVQDFSASFRGDCQQPAFWIGQTGEGTILALAIREGDFHPGCFQNIIPLSYPVYPAAVLADFQDNVFKISPVEQKIITCYRVRFDLGRSSVSVSPQDGEFTAPKNFFLKRQFHEDFRNG